MNGVQIKKRNLSESRELYLKYGINISDVGATLHDQSPFAFRVADKTYKYSPQLELHTSVVNNPDGTYSNSYDLIFDQSGGGAVISLKSFCQPLSLIDYMESNNDCLAVINGGYFFFVDEASRYPQDHNYNLCIRDGLPISLPSADYGVLMMCKGRLEGKIISACGSMEINGIKIEWVGACSGSKRKNNCATLYNSACCSIVHKYSPSLVSKRVHVSEDNVTQQSMGHSDLVIKLDSAGTLRVVDILPGGRTDLFAGNFVLRVPNAIIEHCSLECEVKLKNLDDIDINTIESAITVGPSIMHFVDQSDHPINHDKSLGFQPIFTEERMARSIIYEDSKQRVHLRVFDGAPKTIDFKGLTPKEVIGALREDDIRWGFYLDSGQSSRLIINNPRGEFDIYGNLHYLKWPNNLDSPFFLDYKHGRSVSSAICIER